MRNKNFSAAFGFVVAAALVISSSCGRKSPVSPNPFPIPDPSQYEKLPATHPILDENGKETKMRVELVGEPVPPRGSFVKPGNPSGPPDCSKGECYQFPAGIRLYFDGTPNPNKGARFTGFFSEDGKSSCGGAIFGRSVNPNRPDGNPGIYGTDGIYQFFPVGCVLKYLLIEGEYNPDINGPWGTIPGEKGSTSFFLDYKVR